MIRQITQVLDAFFMINLLEQSCNSICSTRIRMSLWKKLMVRSHTKLLAALTADLCVSFSKEKEKGKVKISPQFAKKYLMIKFNHFF